MVGRCWLVSRRGTTRRSRWAPTRWRQPGSWPTPGCPADRARRRRSAEHGLPGSQVLRFIVPGYVQDDPALARAYDEASADSMCDRAREANGAGSSETAWRRDLGRRGDLLTGRGRVPGLSYRPQGSRWIAGASAPSCAPSVQPSPLLSLSQLRATLVNALVKCWKAAAAEHMARVRTTQQVGRRSRTFATMCCVRAGASRGGRGASTRDARPTHPGGWACGPVAECATASRTFTEGVNHQTR